MDSSLCSNCGHTAVEAFCPNCGQRRRNYRRALPPMLWELITESLDMDARIAQTIRLLLFKPGELAIEFSKGRRARYITPFRLYLFISLAFLFVLSINGGEEGDVDVRQDNVVTINSDLTQDSGPQRNIEPLMAILSEQRQAKVRNIIAKGATSGSAEIMYTFSEALKEQPDLEEGLTGYGIEQMVDALEDPQRTFDKAIENLPIAMFILLPFFALLLKVLYIGRQKYYVEHLVFATHLHSFAYLLYALLILLSDQLNLPVLGPLYNLVTPGLWLYLMIYHLIALHRYYGRSKFGTVARFVVQMSIYFAVLMPTSFVALLLLTLVSV